MQRFTLYPGGKENDQFNDTINSFYDRFCAAYNHLQSDKINPPGLFPAFLLSKTFLPLINDLNAFKRRFYFYMITYTPKTQKTALRQTQGFTSGLCYISVFWRFSLRLYVPGVRSEDQSGNLTKTFTKLDKKSPKNSFQAIFKSKIFSGQNFGQNLVKIYSSTSHSSNSITSRANSASVFRSPTLIVMGAYASLSRNPS